MAPILTKVEWEEWTDFVPSPCKLIQGRVPDQLMHQIANIAVGVDPGRNFGFTVIREEKIWVYYGTFPKEEELWMYMKPAYELVKQIGPVAKFINMAVEGPSFRAKYGQAGLESVRAGFALSGHHMGYNVEVVPPATVRAEVLGHGYNKAGDFWPSLNLNAADSVAIALYAAGVRRGDDPPQRWPEKE